MSTSQRTTDVSLVIEWENVQLAEATRCLQMLSAIARQASRLSEGEKFAGRRWLEVLVMYDDTEVSLAEVRAAVAPRLVDESPYWTVRYEPASGCEYYQQKNRGAAIAASPIVAFLDSDVIPEAGWLAGVVLPFENPSVEVVCGACHLAAENTYTRAFAVSWVFPLRETNSEGLVRKTHFFANNVAFRRQTLLDNPFPEIEGATRGSCSALARSLTQQDIGIYLSTEARVSHPAPNGSDHFFARALAEGRDNYLGRKLRGKAGFFRMFPKVAIRPLKAGWQVLSRGHRVGMSLVEMPHALAVAMGYQSLVVMGDIATRVAPEFAITRWQV